MGTVLCRSGSVSFAQPKRSSIHSRQCLRSCNSCSPLAAYDDFVAPDIYLKFFQRSGRWSRDVSPVEAVRAIVAGAPDCMQIVPVLNGAAQMSANGGHGVVLALRRQEQ